MAEENSSRAREATSYGKILMNLEEAKKDLYDALEVGTKCRCCGRWAQMYKRRIISTMIKTLADLLRLTRANPERRYFHIKEFIKNTNGVAFATTEYWGLVERRPHDPNDSTKKTSGMWAITQKGIDFLQGREKLPKYIWTYDDRLIKISAETCDVHEALRRKFNYQEMMNGI